MRSLIQKLAESAGDAPGTLLVVGAGQGADLAPLRRLGAKRLILVEANPRQADMLSQRVDAGRGEEVWSLAVTPTAQPQATLLIVNQPVHSSLANLDQLPQFFQNLRVVQQEVVPARSLEDIVDGLTLDPAQRHILVIDAPGLAAELLDAISDDRLQQFQSLIVRGGAKSLYTGEKPIEQVITAMRGRAFDLVADDAEAIFPHQAVLLVRNEVVCHARVLRERVHALELELQDRTRLATEREGMLESLGSVRDALLRERDALLAERDGQQAKMADLQAQWDSESATRESVLADLRAQVQSLAQERDTLATQVTELRAQLDAGEARSAAQAKFDAEREELVQQLTKRRDMLTRHVAELKAQLDAGAAQVDAQAAELKVQIGAQAERVQESLAEVRKLAGERDELGRQLAEQQALVQRLVQMRDTLTRQVADYRKQVEANADLAAQLEARTAESTAHKELAEERLVQMLAQAQEQEASVKKVAERDAALAKLAKELESAKSLADEQQEKLERASRLSQERGMRVIELERERAELDKYQSWLSAEVIKAEAHVDLIKEILLREPGQ